ncbi:hypothetical protein C9I86_19450 [Photobacterium sp. NCIMB 13483]|uniref:hypothetical protein n=1 Tax=Photobacterium sp. NCIMB 13483 TaxID=2022103 RepID=UPI000D165C78|nr:hypothetical protein [Photobacterium sp. NCIMB 13483]PST85359.1 hypothetical protein C9I86_19450 [Photobacterium sp. NCIMB 13483]
MISTSIGSIDGNLWESLIQSVYKRKYDSYQEMIASPGDLGIEGFVLDLGIVIQCYCPAREYDTPDLHKKQVNKITKDIQKLVINEIELQKHLGGAKIKQWIFATPSIAKHDIHIHARNKEKEIKEKNLSIIDENFQILIKDLGFFEKDIRNIQVVNGEQLDFSNYSGSYIYEPNLTTEYDGNIFSKNKVRSYKKEEYIPFIHERLNEITKKDYVDGYEILNAIYTQSPELYERISKVINNFENYVEMESLTWEGTPKTLIDHIRDKLISRLENDEFIKKSILYENLVLISEHMISRWIAHCPMRILE